MVLSHVSSGRGANEFEGQFRGVNQAVSMTPEALGEECTRQTVIKQLGCWTQGYWEGQRRGVKGS